MNDEESCFELCRSGVRGEDITIYGDGSQTRSFQYVDDLIRGMVLMMENDSNFIGPVNLGNPGEFTIKELAEKVIEMTGSESKIVYNDLPVDDPRKRRPDITLAITKLDWEPIIKFEHGLAKTIELFRGALNI